MTYMERALTLARRALGSTSPNPSVGAVVVKNGKIVAEGWTQPPGGEHAEAMALRLAGPKASGATLYTSLEPCNHFGRTPPCTEAIIKSGIAEVHASFPDPNPHVEGRGVRRLEEAGIRCFKGEDESEARQVIEAFAKYARTGNPFVTAKFAMSLDGKIASRSGDSKWVTGEESRRFVHRLRSEVDAVMVGINTALADDPQLTARDSEDAPLSRQPLRVVVDSNGRMPKDARMLSEPGETLIVTSDAGDRGLDEASRTGTSIMRLPNSDGRVDVGALLELLGAREVTSVLVEGGGTLLGSLFDLGLVDKVVAFVAPVIIGGKCAPSPVGGAGIENMADALRLKDVEISRFGADVAIIGYCKVGGDVHWNS
jgi:diaminohydroxyphosphoribosylaminopyrimidine deaminase/5-amino-6-(5-phosphoribosylamino)uracil reductase